MKGKDFLSVGDLTPDDVQRIIKNAVKMKQKKAIRPVLAGKTLALVFEKPSLRTRVSFDVAMHQLGGHSVYLSQAEVGLGGRESISDAAKTLSRYVDGIAARTFAQATVEALAKYASVPVINALSDGEHPCQALADIMTMYEKKGKLKGLTVAYIGDGNNVATSLLLACTLVGANFRIASPKGYELSAKVVSLGRRFVRQSGAEIQLLKQPEEAVKGVDVVYTDVWTSMGQEAEAVKRRKAFAGYQVDARLLKLAKKDAIFMHPLPAHHGEEVAHGIIDSKQSVAFGQAENRLHVQKAILVELLGK
ncbi:MAG TPA: ornithine carbamoyltransferase [Dehalococcoidia bacterium]|nr:ornithine carbamoyltransferase [Dehalococcoidia bacterium]